MSGEVPSGCSDQCGTGASVFSSLQLAQAFLTEQTTGGHLSGRYLCSVKLKGDQAPNLNWVNGVAVHCASLLLTHVLLLLICLYNVLVLTLCSSR